MFMYNVLMQHSNQMVYTVFYKFISLHMHTNNQQYPLKSLNPISCHFREQKWEV